MAEIVGGGEEREGKGEGERIEVVRALVLESEQRRNLEIKKWRG